MNAYKIDFVHRTVTITKAFAIAANTYNSKEYTMLNDLQRQGFIIVNQKHTAPKNRKPTPSYAQMKQYISCLAESEIYQKRYETVCEAAKSYNNPIIKVRKWFNATFPNYSKLPEFDENGRIIVTPKGHDANTLKAAS